MPGECHKILKLYQIDSFEQSKFLLYKHARIRFNRLKNDAEVQNEKLSFTMKSKV